MKNIESCDFIELLKIVKTISNTATKTDNQKGVYDIRGNELNQEKLSILLHKYEDKQ